MIKSEACEQKTDEELVGLAIADPEYFFCLAKRFETKLLYYIRRISALPLEDAEDLLQEVYIKTYQNLNGFDVRLKFSSWIYRIAHNQTISELRKRNVRPTVALEDDSLSGLIHNSELIDLIDNKFEAAKIAQAMNALDAKYQEVLTLRYIEEKDYVEIADILEKPVSTVGNLISRGRIKFKAEYEKLIPKT